jgi:hypothetical protein
MQPRWAIYIVLIAIMLSVLACLSGITKPAGEVTNEYEIYPSQRDIVITQEHPLYLEGEQSCGPDNWQLIPLAKFEHPKGDGWKLLIVELALTNQSNYWGEYKASSNKATVLTEDGYIYSAIVGPMSIPKGIDSPYSGKYISGPQIGGGPPMIVGGGIATRGPLPPKFSVYNITRLDRLTLKPINTRPFSLFFNVAENQDNFTIFMDQIFLICFLPNGSEMIEKDVRVSLTLGRDFEPTTFQSNVAHDKFQNIPSQMDIPGKGTLIYLGANRITFDEYTDLVILSFQYTSTSGYNTEGSIVGYMIGDDGVVVYPGCGNRACSENDSVWYGPGSFRAGPGQTSYTDLGFLISKQAENLKFIWLGEKGIFPTYEVFNIPLQ